MIALLLLVAGRCFAGTTGEKESATDIVSATAASDGLVHIVTRAGVEFVAPKEVNPVAIDGTTGAQEALETPVISPDKRTVGWLADFTVCCQSYPIPLVLVLYRDGKIVRRISSGMGIFHWVFVGEDIAYFTDTSHGNLGPECTRVSIASGRVTGRWSRGGGPLPAWAKAFRQDIGD